MIRKRLAAIAASAVVIAGGLTAYLGMGSAQAAACTAQFQGTCGAYSWNVASNGFNSYVTDQSVGPQTPAPQDTMTVNSATNWTLVANDQPYGYTGVQTAPQTNQLLNDYCPANKDWADPACASNQTETDTPFSALNALSIDYSVTMPPDGTGQGQAIYEYGIDTWPDNYGNDIMTWTNTSLTRCTQNGLSSTDILGQMPLGGKNYTLYRYGGAGGELVFILDGSSSTDPVDTGTCAKETSGTIDVLGEYSWMVANHIIPDLGSTGLIVPAVLENTSATNATFTLNSLSMTMTTGPGTPTPTPTATTPTPTPTPTTPTPTPTTPTPTPTATSPTPTPSPTPTTAPGTVLVGYVPAQPTVDSNPAGVAQAYQYVATASGTAAQVGFYVDRTSTATAGQLGVYSDAGGHPGTLLGKLAFKPARYWNKLTFPHVNIVKGARYWLAELGVTGTLAYRDRAGSGPASETATVGSALPSKYPAGHMWNSGSAMFYLATAPGTPTPTPTPTPTSPTPTPTTPTPTPTSTGGTYSCVTSADNGYCPGPGAYYSYPAVSLNGGQIYLNNNVFSHNQLPSATQTLSSNSPGDWKVDANMANGSTPIISGPQARIDLGFSPLTGYSHIEGGFTDNLNANAGTDAEAGWDVWSSANPGSAFSQEMMIWTDSAGRGTCGGATTIATGVQFGGANGVPVHNWDLCRNGPAGAGSEYIWWLPDYSNQMPSGSVDILGMTNYLVAHGYYPAGTGINQVDQTLELASTGGQPESFVMTGLSVSSG